MKLVPSNRMVGDLQTRIYAPGSRVPLNDNAVIDTDTVDFSTASYYIRCFYDGDMVEFVEPVVEPTPVDKPVKIKD